MNAAAAASGKSEIVNVSNNAKLEPKLDFEEKSDKNDETKQESVTNSGGSSSSRNGAALQAEGPAPAPPVAQNNETSAASENKVRLLLLSPHVS